MSTRFLEHLAVGGLSITERPNFPLAGVMIAARPREADRRRVRDVGHRCLSARRSGGGGCHIGHDIEGRSDLGSW